MRPERWILLRGFTREVGHWGDFLSIFEAATGAEVCAVDLPGAGRFNGVTCPLTVAGMMGFVRRRAHEEGWLSGPVNVFAVSLGGMLALEWMARHPHEIARAAIVNSSLASLSPFYMRLRWQVYRDLLTGVARRNLLEKEKRILRLISNREEIHDVTAQDWAELAVKQPMSTGNIVRQLTAAATYRGPKRPPAGPVLWMSSNADRLVDPRCTERLYRRFGGEWIRHGWGGHDLTLDDPVWVAEAVRRWLSQSVERASTAPQPINP